MQRSSARKAIRRYGNAGLFLASLSPRLSAYWALRRRSLLGIALVAVGLAVCFANRPRATPTAIAPVAVDPNALLFAAIERKDAAGVLSALHQCAGPNAVRAGRTALSYAAETRDYDVVRTLLERGADPNADANAVSERPLTIAAGCGDETLVEMLLAKGANPNARDARDASCLSDPTAVAVAKKNWLASGKRDTRFTNIIAMLQKAMAVRK